MAFELQITQTVRLACDRCGKPQPAWHDSVEAAIEAARGDYVDASWEEGDCRRQCRVCGVP